jgi:hypothetical protein
MKRRNDGQRYLDNEKYAHDNYQHECRAVLVVGSFGLLVALVKELLPFLLCEAHRSEQQDVQEYKHYARQEMHEDNTEHEVERKIVVLAKVVIHPVGESLMANNISLALPYSFDRLINSARKWNSGEKAKNVLSFGSS